MIHLPRKISSITTTVILAGAITGCTSSFYSKSAHRETVGILHRKGARVPNSGRGILDINPPPPASLDQLARNLTTVDFLGDRAFIEKDAKVLTLAEALRFGVHRNRTYLDQKEALYLQALDLTLARHEFDPIFSAAGTATHDRVQVEQGVNNFVTDSTQTLTGGVGFSMLTKAGTRIAADLTTDFFRFLTGQLREVSESELAVTLTQPLLRGAGYLAVTEALTQNERSMLYAVRDFTQYRKSFAVDLCSQYYRTLQARDATRNAFLAYKAFQTIVEREQAMEAANRRSLTSLLQLEQAALSYHRRWLAAIQSYEQQLDELKIQLGLPVETRFILDERELSKLKLYDPPGTLNEAIETALATRLDLWNARDTLEDTNRKIRVAKQDLLPTLNTVLKYNVVGDPDTDGLNLDGHRRSVSAGLDVDLHLDKKAERNTLRSAEVAEQKARRQLDLGEENVRLQVRTDWRELDLARKQYELAVKGVALSERRLEAEEDFLKENKSSSARDLIDAQQDLIEARDLLTATLISHTISRLTLWKDMGILFIKKDGDWVDVLEHERPKGDE